MRFERLLADRYIRSQKRQSAFTVISIIVAVAIITMVFVLYGVFINNYKNITYSSAPYHLLVSGITEEQAEAIHNDPHVERLILNAMQDDKVAASVMFKDDIGDREGWLQNLAIKNGFEKIIQDKKYEWNDKLMMLDSIGDNAHLAKLRIFCIFFIFAIFMAFSLRLVIDTAFEISSKDRERQYGVLQSIGATPEQVVKIITSEALKLCIIAIPFGLVSGIVFAYAMYHLILNAGLTNIFQRMANTITALPFSIEPLMLLVAAVVGVVWVFLSAYGVGMRVIRKSPMEAITVRENNVKKVKLHTLSGLLFGVSGSIASRNARRQKKRFVITVLTLTVSITLFALFSTLTVSVEHSITNFINFNLMESDFSADLISHNYKGTSYEDNLKEIAESGLFKDIGIIVSKDVYVSDSSQTFYTDYVNKEYYERLFGDDPEVSYEELAETGGYILNTSSSYYKAIESEINNNSVQIATKYRNIDKDKITENMNWIDLYRASEVENKEHTFDIIGKLKGKTGLMVNGQLVGAIDTYNAVKDDYYSNFDVDAVCFLSAVNEGGYNAQNYKKIIDFFNEHIDDVEITVDGYKTKWITHNVISAIKTGVLILNVMIALMALINLMNIISTGIANRRAEFASLQCVGMTDKQLRRMAVIECLQFIAAATFISALICALLTFGTETILRTLLQRSFVDESKETRKMLMELIKIDHITPFVRIGAASLAAFAAGCITSFVMLRMQNTDSLSDQIRGTDMKTDAKESHLLRNSVIAVVGALVLIIAGLHTYSVISYRNDRKEYAKAGYLNLVESNGFKMNVYHTGKENGKHTIVGLAGFPNFAFPVETTKLNELLGKENTIVYPDRAGYGFSDDSLKKQTLRQVVEDYRTGLKNAGFEAPYVLMGHSYGGYYAMMWEEMYPEEVESIIFLSGTSIPKNECWSEIGLLSDYPSIKEAKNEKRRMFLITWLGLNRLFPHEETDEVSPGAAIISEEEKALIECCDKRSVTAAVSSEYLNMDNAERELMTTVKPTDTPKIYFSNIPTCVEDLIEFHNFVIADYKAEGKKPAFDPETAAKTEWKKKEWYYKRLSDDDSYFADCVGNCRIVNIGGDHGFFYLQKPQQVADHILDFLAETEE